MEMYIRKIPRLVFTQNTSLSRVLAFVEDLSTQYFSDEISIIPSWRVDSPARNDKAT
jgi:hypothetical protein